MPQGPMRNPHAVRGWKDTGLWTAVELAVFSAVSVLLLFAYFFIERPKSFDPDVIPGPLFTISLAAAMVAMLLLWRIFRHRARGATRADLGYSFSRESIIAGIVGGASLNPFVELGISRIDEWLFGPEPDLAVGMKEAGLIVAVLFLVGNGVFVPIVEEYVWRGMIQRHFRRAWGPIWALIATALLFTAKHIVTDLYYGRTLQLLVFSFVVCYVGSRWGTGASTIAHLLANTGATLLFILDTYGIIQIY